MPPWRIILRYFIVGLLIGGMLLLLLLVGALACAVVLGTGIQAAITASSPWLMLAYATSQALAAVSVLISTVIVLTFYVMLRYSMAAFCVVDGKEVMESLRESAKLTYGVKWHLVGFMFVSMGVYLLGIAALLIGLLVAVPVIMFAYAHIYTVLKSRVE